MGAMGSVVRQMTRKHSGSLTCLVCSLPVPGSHQGAATDMNTSSDYVGQTGQMHALIGSLSLSLILSPSPLACASSEVLFIQQNAIDVLSSPDSGWYPLH